MDKDFTNLVKKWVIEIESHTNGDYINILQDIFNKFQPSCSTNDYRLVKAILNLIELVKTERSFTVAFAYRTYYRIIQNTSHPDVFYLNLAEYPLQNQFYILHAILFTEYHKKILFSDLQLQVFNAFEQATCKNTQNLVIILRVVNLFIKKYKLECIPVPISLEQFYFCMQSQEIGPREETMVLFSSYTKDLDKAVEFFDKITHFWSWTNRNKFYLLSIIVNNWKFEKICKLCNFSRHDFFEGLRFSLTYKRLFSAGQSLAKALSCQYLQGFYSLVVEIIRHGSHRELKNLYSQWYGFINNRKELLEHFEISDTTFASFCADVNFQDDNFRIVILLHIFPDHFLKESSTIENFLMESCFKKSKSIQLFCWKFLVDYLPNLDYEKVLKFFITFVSTHVSIPCSEFRNIVLAKLIPIFKFLSKLYSKNAESKPLIRYIFSELRCIFDKGLNSKEYQPIIFSLKMFDIMLKTLFSESCKRVTKNYSVQQNQKLANYLKTDNIFNFTDLESNIFNTLQECREFDDVRELIVQILKHMKTQNVQAHDNWIQCVSDPQIDRCFLSSFYSKIYLQVTDRNEVEQNHLKCSFEQLLACLETYENDPLISCKSGKHLFGYINTINEIFLAVPAINPEIRIQIIGTLELIIKMILRLLNAVADYNECSAASFQIIEESLEVLVLQSKHISSSQSDDQKYLMSSFWNTLKACCDLATTIGCISIESSETNDTERHQLKRCLDINVTVLHLCRHKGAIESAGLSLGLLVKTLSKQHGHQSKSYEMLYTCFPVLFGSVCQISTTRRGAGLSIMFNQLVRNDIVQNRPLFRHAIKTLLDHCQSQKSKSDDSSKQIDQQHENFDALVLHYLCVLVKDTELKDNVAEYYDTIMLSAIKRIEDKEWTVRNAALQLFGAIVPKIVGQKQAADTDEPILWEPSEITFLETRIRLPRTCEYIIEYCDENKNYNIRPGSTILFLEFLSNVEYLKKDSEDCPSMVFQFRELFWKFLSHENEKIRYLAALCMVRSHEFQLELPRLILQISAIFFKLKNENFMQGLLYVLIYGLKKINSEWKFTMTVDVEEFLVKFRYSFEESYTFRSINYYVRNLIIELFILAGFDFNKGWINELIGVENVITTQCQQIGYDLWLQNTSKLFQMSNPTYSSK